MIKFFAAVSYLNGVLVTIKTDPGRLITPGVSLYHIVKLFLLFHSGLGDLITSVLIVFAIIMPDRSVLM